MKAAVVALALAGLLAAALPCEAAGGDLDVLVGRGVDGAGRPLAPGRVVIRGGRIVASATSPAETLDASAFVVAPGFIDARSSAGLSTGNEEGSVVSPSLLALDLVEPGADDFRQALASGVTTVVVAPGGRAVIGGLAAVVKTDARPLAERVVAREAALVLTLGDEPALGNRLSRDQTPRGVHFRRPGNRMGVISAIRRAFLAAARGDRSADSDVLRRAATGDLPLWWRAHAEQDIRTAFRLTDELALPKPVLVDPVEAHRVPELVAKDARGAVVGPFYQMPRTLVEAFEGEDFRDATAAILAKAGVPVAVGSGPQDPPDVLRDRAALAWRAGLAREDAVAAITSTPARLLGLDARLGDLTPGHDGDLVVLDGDPLAPTSRVLAVVVEGRLAWTCRDWPLAGKPEALQPVPEKAPATPPPPPPRPPRGTP